MRFCAIVYSIFLLNLSLASDLSTHFFSSPAKDLLTSDNSCIGFYGCAGAPGTPQYCAITYAEDGKKILLKFYKYNYKNKNLELKNSQEISERLAADLLELLKEEGFLIDWVKDGQECFDKLEESDEGYYDLILMDIQMPILNGYDTTAKIRQMENPKKAATPIVAMTANAFEEDIAMTQKVGMNGFIAKPLDAEKMFTILKQSIVEN